MCSGIDYVQELIYRVHATKIDQEDKTCLQSTSEWSWGAQCSFAVMKEKEMLDPGSSIRKERSPHDCCCPRNRRRHRECRPDSTVTKLKRKSIGRALEEKRGNTCSSGSKCGIRSEQVKFSSAPNTNIASTGRDCECLALLPRAQSPVV